MVLPVALFIMLIVTLLAVSTMQTSTIDLKIAQNRQARIQTERAVERGIERVIDRVTSFTDTPNFGGGTGIENYTISNWTVVVERPYCISSTPAQGYSVTAPLIPEYNVFAFEACATDTVTGARVVMQQGIRMLMLSGNCVPLPTDPIDPCA